MRYSTPASLLAFAAFVLANEASSDVLSLTAATFESTVEAEPLLLVEFFAPWYVLLSFLLFFTNSSFLGAAIAKLWLLITKRPQLLSRRRISNLPRSTVLTKLIFVSQKEFKDIRECPTSRPLTDPLTVILQNLEGLPKRGSHRLQWSTQGRWDHQLHGQVSQTYWLCPQS